MYLQNSTSKVEAIYLRRKLKNCIRLFTREITDMFGNILVSFSA